MKFILGQKSNMSQIFGEDGRVIPVTVVKAGPCTVTQVKKQDGKDGYRAIQIGFGSKKSVTKPVMGHLKDLSKFRYLKEFRADEGVSLERGQVLKANVFAIGDQVKVTGIYKGHGYQGVVKRHGFHGSPASHGHKDQLRMPGSIGSTGPQRVLKGVRMAGQMGNEQVTVKNLEVVKIDAENNLLYLKGAVPGANGTLLLIQGPGELKIVEEVVTEPVAEAQAEAPAAEQLAEEAKPEEVKAEEAAAPQAEVNQEEKAEQQ